MDRSVPPARLRYTVACGQTAMKRYIISLPSALAHALKRNSLPHRTPPVRKSFRASRAASRNIPVM